MKALPTIAESRCRKQAKVLFNNNLSTLTAKFEEEQLELLNELKAPVIDIIKVLEEFSDVNYILNQIAEELRTTNDESLNSAFKKLQKRHSK